MPIDIACVKCAKPLRVQDQFAGQAVRCPHCQQPMRVPQPAPPPPAPPPPPPAPEPEPIPAADLADEDPRERRRDPDDREEEKPRRRRREEEPRRGRRDSLDDDVQEMRQREQETDTVKPLPAALAEEARDLGRPVFHEDRSVNYRLVALIPAGIAALLGCLLLYGASVRANGLRNIKERPPPPSFYVIPVVPAVLAVLAAVFLRKRTDETWICPGGMAWVKGRDIGFVPWEDVRLFQPKTTTVIEQTQGAFSTVETDRYQVQSCRIAFRGGRSFEFEGFDKVGFLHRQVMKTLYPAYRERLDDGRKVKLEPFELSAKWMALGADEVPWRDIKEVYVVNNHVCVEGHHGQYCFKVPLGQVDMASVLVAVATEMVQRANPAPPPGARAEGQPPAPERNPFDFT